MNFIQRIIEWNSVRYEQVFHKGLTVNLIDEELNELAVAETNEVEQLDALIDIVYVAIGAMWKRGLDADQINRAIHAVCDSNDSKSITKTNPDVKANLDKGNSYKSPTEALQAILNERNS